MNHELPDVQAGFRKGRGTRDQLSTSSGSLKKKKTDEFNTLKFKIFTWQTDCNKSEKTNHKDRENICNTYNAQRDGI